MEIKYLIDQLLLLPVSKEESLPNVHVREELLARIRYLTFKIFSSIPKGVNPPISKAWQNSGRQTRLLQSEPKTSSIITKMPKTSRSPFNPPKNKAHKKRKSFCKQAYFMW